MIVTEATSRTSCSRSHHRRGRGGCHIRGRHDAPGRLRRHGPRRSSRTRLVPHEPMPGYVVYGPARSGRPERWWVPLNRRAAAGPDTWTGFGPPQPSPGVSPRVRTCVSPRPGGRRTRSGMPCSKAATWPRRRHLSGGWRRHQTARRFRGSFARAARLRTVPAARSGHPGVAQRDDVIDVHQVAWSTDEVDRRACVGVVELARVDDATVRARSDRASRPGHEQGCRCGCRSRSCRCRAKPGRRGRGRTRSSVHGP